MVSKELFLILPETVSKKHQDSQETGSRAIVERNGLVRAPLSNSLPTLAAAFRVKRPFSREKFVAFVPSDVTIFYTGKILASSAALCGGGATWLEYSL